MPIVDECFAAGADIAKIACKVNNKHDAARLTGLYSDKRSIISLGMGKPGRVIRIMATLLGAPFTFASLGKGHETADGQLDKATIKAALRYLQGD